MKNISPWAGFRNFTRRYFMSQFQLGASNSDKDKYLKKRKTLLENKYEIVQYEIREDKNLRRSSQS